MLLIDEPYVSPFLIDTARRHGFPLIATPTARRLVDDNTLPWVAPEEALRRIDQRPDYPLYSASENGLAWLVQHLPHHELTRHSQALKDKARFRALIQDLFPDFYYRPVSLAEIQGLDPEALPFPLVVKPSVGFFSIGVHVVHTAADWPRVKAELQPERLKSIFPPSVLDTEHFLLEALIPGEEYAIDYYHDAEGRVVILNLLHHVFSSGTDTSDRVYTTSQEIILQHRGRIGALLSEIGSKLNLRNFPAHAEVRIDAQGRVVPIEVNPLRFGGWCTSGDLLGVSLGLNAYAHFFHQQTPDWAEVFRGKEDKLYSIVVLNNNSGLAEAEIAGFDYDRLAADFEHPVEIRQLDIQRYPTFGFVFAETSRGNQKELREILTSDLQQYVVRK